MAKRKVKAKPKGRRITRRRKPDLAFDIQAFAREALDDPEYQRELVNDLRGGMRGRMRALLVAYARDAAFPTYRRAWAQKILAEAGVPWETPEEHAARLIYPTALKAEVTSERMYRAAVRNAQAGEQPQP